MSYSNTPRRSPRIAEKMASESNQQLRRSPRIAQKMTIKASESNQQLRRSARIAEKNRLATIESYKNSTPKHCTVKFVPAIIDNYRCWFNTNTGFWVSEMYEFEGDNW